MNCRKCGKPLEDNATYCSDCGTAVKRQRKHPLKKIITAFAVILLCLLMLVTGVEIGRSHSESLPPAPDFITMIANAITELPGIPFNIELTQEQLNEMLNKNAENLKPLEGAKLTISKDKTLILTGNVSKDSFKELIDGEIPSYISIFLPKNISLYVEVSFPQAEENVFEISIKNVTIAGITFAEDFTEALGINKLVSNIISQLIESEQSPYYQLSGISIDKSKKSDENVLIVSGTAKLS